MYSIKKGSLQSSIYELISEPVKRNKNNFMKNKHKAIEKEKVIKFFLIIKLVMRLRGERQ